MRVMVTGGTGFLGGHVVRALLDEGHQPHRLVRSKAKLRQLVDLFDFPADIGRTVSDMRSDRQVDPAGASP